MSIIIILGNSVLHLASIQPNLLNALQSIWYSSNRIALYIELLIPLLLVFLLNIAVFVYFQTKKVKNPRAPYRTQGYFHYF